METQKLFAVIDSLNDEYIALWEKVCNIESPTIYKAGVDAVGDVFIELARERGWHIEVLEHKVAGNAICITLNPDSNEQAVVFSGHIDTVHPIGLFPTPAVHMDEEIIYGPGVLDCKGGVVASFMAMQALEKCGFTSRPIKLIIQSDEETSSKTSNKETVRFMQKKSENAIAFLNTEGIQGETAVLVRKGILRYKYTVFGKAAHAATCLAGANAIAEAAHKILKLEAFKDPDSITCNCGRIEGGTVANTVAEMCSFIVDFRFANEQDLQKVKKAVVDICEENHVAGCRCELEEISYRPPMPMCQRNGELLNKINEIYARVGMPQLTARKCLSGSDAAYITEAGIPCVDNLGVDGGRIHSIDEFSYLRSLAECAKRLASVAYLI